MPFAVSLKLKTAQAADQNDFSGILGDSSIPVPTDIKAGSVPHPTQKRNETQAEQNRDRQRRACMDLVYKSIKAAADPSQAAPPKQPRHAALSPPAPGRWPFDNHLQEERKELLARAQALRKRPQVDGSGPGASPLLSKGLHSQAKWYLRESPPDFLVIWHGHERSCAPIRVAVGHLRTMTEILTACAGAVRPSLPQAPRVLYKADGTAVSAIDKLSGDDEYVITRKGFPFDAGLLPYRMLTLQDSGEVFVTRKGSCSTRAMQRNRAAAQEKAAKARVRSNAERLGIRNVARPTRPKSPPTSGAIVIEDASRAWRGRHYPTSLTPSSPPCTATRRPDVSGSPGQGSVVVMPTSDTQTGPAVDETWCVADFERTTTPATAGGVGARTVAATWEEGWKRISLREQQDSASDCGQPDAEAAMGAVSEREVALQPSQSAYWWVETVTRPVVDAKDLINIGAQRTATAESRRLLLPSQLPECAPASWRSAPDNVLVLSNRRSLLPLAELRRAPHPPLLFHIDGNGTIGSVTGHLTRRATPTAEPTITYPHRQGTPPPAPGRRRQSARREGRSSVVGRRLSTMDTGGRRLSSAGVDGGYLRASGQTRRQSKAVTAPTSPAQIERFLLPCGVPSESETESKGVVQKKKVRFNEIHEVLEYEAVEESSESESSESEEEHLQSIALSIRKRMTELREETEKRAAELEKSMKKAHPASRK